MPVAATAPQASYAAWGRIIEQLIEPFTSVMYSISKAFRLAPLVCACLLAACASTAPPGEAPAASAVPASMPAPAKPAATPGLEQAALAAIDEAGKQFDTGNYNGAIKILTAAQAIDFASMNTQVKAHKLLAFSYCSIRKTAQCNSEFSRILQIQPAYQLPEAERFHPIWGPAFEAARKKTAQR